MYNFALAFFICALLYVIGEVISTISKAWIPSVFVTAALMLVGYWTFLPQEVITDAQIIPFAGGMGMFLLLVHMGSVISFEQLLAQWKTIVLVLSGLAGMVLFSFVIGPMLVDRALIIAGLPPLTGGIVAATMMQQAAEAKGLQDAAIFAIAMYCVQGFAGYPLTAICLQNEGKKMLSALHAGSTEYMLKNDETVETSIPKKKLIPPMPEKYNSVAMVLMKLAILAWVASQLGTIEFPVIGKISAGVWALLVGILASTIGLLDSNALGKAQSNGFITFGLMMYIFDGLKLATPEMLSRLIGPMIILIIIGVTGMAIFVFIASKILKTTFALSFATALTALYGFPPNAVITENTCNALAKTPEEKDYLMNRMFPAMIVGGFVSVTITSVIIAGVFTGML